MTRTITGILGSCGDPEALSIQLKNAGLTKRITQLAKGGGAIMTRVSTEIRQFEVKCFDKKHRRNIIPVVLWDPDTGGIDGVPGLFCCNLNVATKVANMNHHGDLPTFKVSTRRVTGVGFWKFEVSGAPDYGDRLRKMPKMLEQVRHKLRVQTRSLMEEAQVISG